jgi:hypothetical protein
MTASSKSKLWWFAGLFFRLLLVTILCFFLSFCLFMAWLHFFGDYVFPTPKSVSDGLLYGGLVFGYAWIIHYRLPLSFTSRQNLFTSIALGIFGAFIACYVFRLLFAFIWWITGAQLV